MAPLGWLGSRHTRRIGMALATLTLVVAQVAPAASATVDEGWVDDAVRFRKSVGLSAGRELSVGGLVMLGQEPGSIARYRLAGRTILLSLLLPVVMITGLAMATPASGSNDRKLEEATQFRKDMGFQAGKDLVERSFANRERFSDTSWGVPLTEDEAAEMWRRSTERPKVQAAIDYAVSRPASGGMYFDQAEGALPVFLFTDDVARHTSEIEERLPPSVEFDVQHVGYSLSELSALQSAITADMDTLRADGLPINQVAVGVQQNRVTIGLEAATEGGQQSLSRRYGPRVAVELIGPIVPDVCTDRHTCRPIKGGLRIGRQNGMDHDLCTIGFNGRRRDNDGRVAITAGHCLALSGGTGNCGPDWRHGDNVFGCARGDSLPACGPTSCPDVVADVGWIKIDADENIPQMNRIFGDGTDDIRPITSTLYDSQIQEGDVLCASRGFSPNKFKCGKVLGPCANLRTSGPPGIDGWKVLCVAVLNFNSINGDSGAPIIEQYYDPVSGDHVGWAAGIHSHSTKDQWCADTGDCRSWFTKASRIESQSPADICTTAGC